MNPYHEKYLGIKSIDKKSPAFLCPLFAYVVAKKIVNIAHTSLFDEFEYKLGREYSKILCGIQKNKGISGNRAIKAALEEFENFGFGKAKVILISRNKILLKNEFSSIARQYKKSFESDNKKIDYFLSGVYSGILSFHLKRKIHIKETSCFAAGSNSCVFEDSFDCLNSYPKLDSLIKSVIKFHRIEGKFVNYPTQLIKTAFEQGHFVKKNGMIKLWNIYSVYFKFGFFAFSCYILSKLHEDTANLYRYLGIVQARIAAQFQKNQYGIKEKNKILESLIKQLDLFGYGHGDIKHIGKKSVVLVFKNINLLYQCSKFMKKYEDPYIEGILIGDAFIINKNVSKIEMSNNSNNELTVKIGFENGVNLLKKTEQKIKSQEIKEIVNEKMTHKYYLSP